VCGDASTDGSVQRPSVVRNVLFYFYPSGAVGGKVTNAPAFNTPVPATPQGDLGRSALRGCDGTMTQKGSGKTITRWYWRHLGIARLESNDSGRRTVTIPVLSGPEVPTATHARSSWPSSFRSKRQRVRSRTSEVSYSPFSRLHCEEHAGCFRAGSKEETREAVQEA
jgi:hypothetical protein